MATGPGQITGASGAPSGAAGGDLTGTYPNPTVKASVGLTGSPTAPSLGITGLTGAASASRYAGATTSGAPTSGTFLTGDWVVDQSGAEYLCTSGGSPGTWLLLTRIPYYSGYSGETGNQDGLLPSLTPALTSGRIYASRMIITKTLASATRTLTYNIITAGSTLTSGQNLIAAYNSAGTQLGSTSADQTSNFGAAGAYSVTVGTFGANAGDVIYVLLLSVGTTPPRPSGMTANQTSAANVGLSGATLRGSVQASAQTAMPGSITPSSLNASNGILIWFGLT